MSLNGLARNTGARGDWQGPETPMLRHSERAGVGSFCVRGGRVQCANDRTSSQNFWAAALQGI